MVIVPTGWTLTFGDLLTFLVEHHQYFFSYQLKYNIYKRDWYNVFSNYSLFSEVKSIMTLVISCVAFPSISSNISCFFSKLSWQSLDGLPWKLVQTKQRPCSMKCDNFCDSLTFFFLSNLIQFNLKKTDELPISLAWTLCVALIRKY